MSMNNKDALLESALYYASLGWPVLPLHTPRNAACSCGKGCRSVGKHPRYHDRLIPNGLRNASADRWLIHQWWGLWSDANIGICTGSPSGLVVIDVDPRHDGDKTIMNLQREYGALPDLFRVRTGSGWHIYLKHPGGFIKSRPIAPGIDVKADGGYVVAPPSKHATGNFYEWELEKMHIDEILIKEK